MKIKFVDSSNSSIDELVRICWANFGHHIGENFRIKSRSDEEIFALINDAEEDQAPEEKPTNSRKKLDLKNFGRTPVTDKFQSYNALIAIDGGIVNLGDFQGGATAFAVRGAAVCILDNSITILRYNTGALIIDESNKVPVFAYMGKRLGNEELYLSRNANLELIPKSSAFETPNQVQDRCRNFVERMIQEEALSILASNKKGLLLLDGALPAGTYDTPVAYMHEMLQKAVSNGVDICAISKKTSLTLGNKRISDLFDDDLSFIGYAPLKEVLRKERDELVQKGEARDIDEVSLANEIYAVRFGLGPPSICFRVDAHNSFDSTKEEVVENVFRNCQIQSCYPKPLIEAHQASSFFYQDIQSLTADVIARTGVIPKEDQSMEWIFQPFGAFGK